MRERVICHLSDFAPEYPGSFVDSLLCLAKHCREKLQIATLCIFPERARQRKWLKRLDNANIKYGFVPPRRNAVLPLRRLLRDFDPVLFHSHFATFDIPAVLLKVTFYRTSKVVWHFHSVAKVTPQQRLKDAIKVRFVARNFVDLFVAVADGAYHNALDRGYSPDKLFLNHNGIDVSRFSPDGKGRLDARATLGATADQTVFLSLGYNPLIKGADLFIKAAERMSRNSPAGSLFVIIARSATKDFASTLPEFARLGPTIRILDPTEDFPRLLSGIDVLVAPSRSEGLSYAVLEAMASRKFVLCSDIPGVRETFRGVEGVWLFPTEDWERLAELMQRAKELTSADRNHLGETNSRYVTVHHSLEPWAARIGSMYGNLLK